MKRILAASVLLVAIASVAVAQTINNLGAGSAVSGTDMFPAYQGSNPAKRVTADQIKTYTSTSAVRTTTTTSEALANSDQGKLVTFSNGSAVACTIAQAGGGGNFAAGWAVSLKNLGAGTVTCTPSTSTVDGAATFTLTTGQGLDLYSDGTNYFTQPGAARNASDLSAGTLAAARGGAGTINGALKGNGSGVVSQAACADLSDDGALCSATPGTGVATAIAANLSAAGGLTTTIASGTSALGTSAISSGACATVVTTTATNTATTDVVLVGFNGDPTAVTGYAPSANGMLTIISYPTANNINHKVCNNTGSSVTPGAITLNWRVVR